MPADDDLNLIDLFPAAYTATVPTWRPGNQNGRPPVEARTFEGLSTKHRAILTLELRGKTHKEIGERLGMSESGISQIVRSRRYITGRDQYLSAVDQEFLNMKPQAFRALRGALDSRDENTALRASEAWMKAAGFGEYSRGAGRQGVTAEDVARQLLEVNVNINVGSQSEDR